MTDSVRADTLEEITIAAPVERPVTHVVIRGLMNRAGALALLSSMEVPKALRHSHAMVPYCMAKTFQHRSPSEVRFEHQLGKFMITLLRAVWLWRSELLMMIPPVGFVLFAHTRLGWIWASAVAVIVVMAPYWIAWKTVLEHLRAMRARRRWVIACRGAGLIDDRILPFGPSVKRVEYGPTGMALEVRCRPHCTAMTLKGRSHELATALHARDVQVITSGRADRARIRVIRHDPFSSMMPIPWELPFEKRSAWDPIPIGMDEIGNEAFVHLPGGQPHFLIGGESGAGKSVAMNVILGALCLDPQVVLYICDGKQVDLAEYEDLATASAGPNTRDAIDVLEKAQAVMKERFARFRDEKRKKVSRGEALHFVVIDELHFYCQERDRDLRNRFEDVLRDLLARGRAAGVLVIAATQKPSTDTIPSRIRDLFSNRLALHCMTPEASDTILGRGWARRGCDASTIGDGQKGVGWMIVEGQSARRMRGYYPTDAQLSLAVKCAKELRGLADEVEPPQPTFAEVFMEEIAATDSSEPRHWPRKRDGKRTPTYVSWLKMRERCSNPNCRDWTNYGARGIRVCIEWDESFDQFCEDLGERPPGRTLERLDVNGNYEPGNVTWATKKEQRANRRDTQ
jgi:hypothetical protein